MSGKQKVVMLEKTLHVLMGTKGQFVKMAPLLRELDRRKIPYNFIHTSQHKEITDQIRDLFCLKEPDTYIVEIGRASCRERV